MPECIHREDKIPDRECDEIDKHPENVNHFSGSNQNEDCWKTKNGNKEDKGDSFFEGMRRLKGHSDNKHICQGNGDRENNGSKEIHKYDKLHAETECPAEVPNEHKFHQVMDGRVDPSAALGQQYAEGIRDNGPTLGLRKEHHFTIGKCPDETCRQETILSQ